jgi:hypothetical protein
MTAMHVSLRLDWHFFRDTPVSRTKQEQFDA